MRPCVSVQSDASVGVIVPGHGGSGGGAKWYVRGHLLASEPGYLSPLITLWRGQHYGLPSFYYQLALLALVWLFLMLHLTRPKRSAATTTAPATPIKPKHKRSNEPKPFAGLTTKPLVPCVNEKPPILNRRRCPPS